jgi:hypothetical protein
MFRKHERPKGTDIMVCHVLTSPEILKKRSDNGQERHSLIRSEDFECRYGKSEPQLTKSQSPDGLKPGLFNVYLTMRKNL